MKKIFLKPFLCALFAIASTFNLAAQNITIDETNFPDEKFRTYLLAQSFGQDAVLTQEEISTIKNLNCSSNYYLERTSSLKGIEYLTELETLENIPENVVSLDLSNNTKLKSISLYSYTNLTSLVLGVQNNLEKLSLKYTKLATIDLSNCPNLKTFDANFNSSISSIDFSNCPNLQSLVMPNSKITTIDLSNNTNLTSINLSGSKNLTSIVLGSNLNNLSTLYCLNCNLNSIDLTGLDNLRTLEIGNPGMEIDAASLSELPSLRELTICYTEMTSLDATVLPNLTRLYVKDNHLTSLDVSQNTALQYLVCSNNFLTSLDVSNNPNLLVLECQHNYITDIDLSNNPLVGDTYTSSGSTSLSPQYKILDLTIVGEDRNKMAFEIPDTSNFPYSEYVQGSMTTGSYVQLNNYTDDELSESKIVDINGKRYYICAEFLSGETHYYDKKEWYSSTTNDIYGDFRRVLKYKLKTNYTGSKNPSITNYIEVFGLARRAHFLYLNPASIQNNRDGVYTGTLYLERPTTIPTEAGVKVYSATAITEESEQSGRLILEEQTGTLPAYSGVVVTASEPGLHIFPITTILKSSSTYLYGSYVSVNEDEQPAYENNILEGTVESSGIQVVPYSVLTLGRRTDDKSLTIGFWNYTGNKISQYRCYIPTDKIPSAMMSPKFQGLNFTFLDKDGSVTNVDAVQTVNGDLFNTPASGTYYDLQGRRVTNPQRGGMYIVNGKKVIF